MSRYLVNEIFYSLQGEGVRAGTANVFVRFAKCNLRCNVAEHGFDCDTDFEHGDWFTTDELLAEMRKVAHPDCVWVIFTGGEPMLQLDGPLVDAARSEGWHMAIETNGTMPMPFKLDWVCVSPKPGTDIRCLVADECKIVLGPGQPLTRYPPVSAMHYLISPANESDDIDSAAALAWCIDLVRTNPVWRLSCQQHKAWAVR